MFPTRVYFDGLGRSLQSVALQASPAQNDLIQPVAYDNLGRQTVSYLPYAGKSTDATGSYRPNAISTDQPAFYYQTGQHLIDTDKMPHAQRVFDNSPLQRLLQAGMAGAGYQPGGTGTQHYKTVSYRPNFETNILAWNPNGTYTTGSFYSANTLNVVDGIDEDNTETLTYADYKGHTILKRQKLGSTNLDTYYLYNNAGMVNYIIPPLATNKLVANSYNLASAILSSIIFKFVYDGRGRIVEKTVPGKGITYIVYDVLNRPVLAQDTNMKAKNQWNYIKYDAKGRTISQGIYTDGITSPTSHIGRVNMQSYVNGLTAAYAANWYETRTATPTNNGYYTSVVFPTAITGTTLSALAYAYYDDYDMNNDGSADFSYSTQSDPSLPNEETATGAQLKGMPTIVSQTTVGAGLSSTWLTKAMFYDKNLHVIQIQSNNHVYYTGAATLTDTKTVVNDFIGMPLNTKVAKKTGASFTTTVYTSITYDQVYRVDTIKQKYNTGGFNPVAAYTYNELGQVIKKGLGYISPASWLQNLDLRYNIHGQLLSINNSKLTSDTGKTSSDANDVFGMLILYDKVDANLTNTPYFNGKISAVKWMSLDAGGSKSPERSFKYSYDQLNRYTASAYAERTTTGTGSFGNNIGGFDEYGITYDNNGNILTLKRNGSAPGATVHHQIDSLVYNYSGTNANQLTKVIDGTDSLHTNQGFRNLTGSTAGYTYDPEGNLKKDPIKGISNISYNVLNRTDTIKITTTQYITYTYDAGGNLIRKQAYKSGTTTQITDYVDGFVYNNSSGSETLSYFPMPEGRVLYNAGAFTQEYVITDPQGNARVSFQNNSGSAKVYQENSYYATGLIMPNSPVAAPGTPNKQLYNGGSEWQNDYTNNLPDYYQTFNRNYDAATGRFISVDPMAESTESTTTYQYAGNNPVMNNDPMGDLADYYRQGRVPSVSAPTGDGFMNDLALSDEGEADAMDPANYSTWNGYDFGGAGDPSLGEIALFHEGNGTDRDPTIGSAAGAIQRIRNSLSQANEDANPSGGNPSGGMEGGTGGGTGPVLAMNSTGDLGALLSVANQGVFYTDGSAFFTNETQAYNYMWKNSNYGKSNYIENFAFITKNGVAVLPTHGTKSTGEAFQNTGYQGEWYGVYQTKGQGSTFAIDFHGIWIYPIASIHTHPGDRFGDNESPDGYDLRAFRSMGIPGFVLGHDHFYGVSLNGDYNTYPAQNLLRGIINIIPNIGLFK